MQVEVDIICIFIINLNAVMMEHHASGGLRTPNPTYVWLEDGINYKLNISPQIFTIVYLQRLGLGLLS
jgi:hypothetical protein